jgi:hypothetical protein
MAKRFRRRIRDLVALAEPAAERAKEHGCAQMDCAQMGRLLMIAALAAPLQWAHSETFDQKPADDSVAVSSI